jgi:hypothetical protein
VTPPDPVREPFPGGNTPGCIRLENGKDLPVGSCKTLEASCGCTYKVCTTKDSKGEPKVFSFEPVAGQPLCKIGKIYVKGGTDRNKYTFDPAAICSSGMVAPENKGISHVDICEVSCC